MGAGVSIRDILAALDLMEIGDIDERLYLVQRVQECIELICSKEDTGTQDPQTFGGEVVKDGST